MHQAHQALELGVVDLSPADGLQVNTQMIEGPNAVVIFDGQLLLSYADEVASYVQTLGKPVDRIILSHAHTDHWAGLQLLTERFPNAASVQSMPA